MKLLLTLALTSLCSISVLADPAVEKSNQKQADEAVNLTEARGLSASLQESRLRMLEDLEQASSPLEKRQVIEQWRKHNQPLIEQMRTQLQAERTTQQTRTRRPAATWTRPAIPEDVPAEERERLELRYELMEARQQMLTKMEGASPQERRQAMEEFRKQTAAHRARMEVVSGLSTQSDALALRDDRLASGSRSQAREPLPVLPVPDNASPEVKARLQARNARIDAINTLESAMNNASPQERRAAIDAYREKMKALQDAQEKTERALPDTRAPEAAVSAH